MNHKAIDSMLAYFRNESYISHALRVHGYATGIGAGEGLSERDFEILQIASLYHDVGIPEGLRLEGSGAGPVQERLGAPIAMELASLTGGVPAIAVAAVLLSGLLGSILAQPLQKALRLEDPVALGVALGTASHAIGTTKALELGEVQGAFSGMAIGISGLFTSLWLALFF